MIGKKWVKRLLLSCCLVLIAMAIPALSFAEDGTDAQESAADTPAVEETQDEAGSEAAAADQETTAETSDQGTVSDSDSASQGQTQTSEEVQQAPALEASSSESASESSESSWKPIYKGVDYSPVFDADYYLSRYTDIRAAFGSDKDKAFDHFLRCGMKEGRQACEDFNVFAYANRYEDLQKAFKNDLPAYYSHYLRCGFAEGRDASPYPNEEDAEKNTSIQFVWADEKSGTTDYSPVFDAVYYLSHNEDLIAAFGNDQQKAFDHFLRCGMKEGRQGCASFNVFAYANRYKDLQKAFKSDLPAYYSHYLRCGLTEGRDGSPYTDENDLDKNTGLRFLCVNLVYRGLDYSLVFDPAYYLENNSDVLAAFGHDQQAAFQHFLKYGMKEGRQGIASFNPLAYANRYTDLQKAFRGDVPAYYSHYIRCGYKEGRDGSSYTEEADLEKNTGLRFDWVSLVYKGLDYSPVFDMDYYMSHYPDLQTRYHFDKQQYFNHFLKYGMSEGRRANSTFNVFAYANRYTDLQKAYQGSLPDYYRHYLRYGLKENRSGADYAGDNPRNSKLCFPIKSAYQIRMDNYAYGLASNTNYMIIVDCETNHLGIYRGARYAWSVVKYIQVSTGKASTPTPKGDHVVTCKDYSFGSGYTCYYATGFIGREYLFHSIIYNQGTWQVQDGRLGVNISHGCVRMAAENAKWIYDNIPLGTRVLIY